MDLTRLEKLFGALADANRLRIIALLLGGERCVCEIQASLGLTQSNVSRHLSYLKYAGLVADQRRGPRVFYRLSEEIRAEAGELLKFLCAALNRKARSGSGRAGAGYRRQRARTLHARGRKRRYRAQPVEGTARCGRVCLKKSD